MAICNKLVARRAADLDFKVRDARSSTQRPWKNFHFPRYSYHVRKCHDWKKKKKEFSAIPWPNTAFPKRRIVTLKCNTIFLPFPCRNLTSLSDTSSKRAQLITKAKNSIPSRSPWACPLTVRPLPLAPQPVEYQQVILHNSPSPSCLYSLDP